METISTEIFRPKPSQYATGALQGWLRKWGWLLLIPLSVCGALAVNRWEWLIVGLIVFFIVYPFLIMMIYFRYALRPETMKFIKPMKLTVKNGDLILNFYKSEEQDHKDRESPVSSDSADRRTEAGEPVYRLDGEEVIAAGNIRSMNSSGKLIVFSLRQPKYATISVPAEIWMDSEGQSVERNVVLNVLEKNGIKFA